MANNTKNPITEFVIKVSVFAVMFILKNFESWKLSKRYGFKMIVNQITPQILAIVCKTNPANSVLKKAPLVNQILPKKNAACAIKYPNAICPNPLVNGLKISNVPLNSATLISPLIVDNRTKEIIENIKNKTDVINQGVKNFSNLEAGKVIYCKLLEKVPISDRLMDVNTNPVTKNANTPNC